ncbi:unannotated protein [freshwater metagenome]|uniref:Unannotated protein n=2 Tax=freshwater metagenome TaxID=449393 RepID=A0A6J6AY40_9ZZZZ
MHNSITDLPVISIAEPTSKIANSAVAPVSENELVIGSLKIHPIHPPGFFAESLEYICPRPSRTPENNAQPIALRDRSCQSL